MYMYSILLFYCFLLKILSTNTVGESSGPSMDRLVAFFGRFFCSQKNAEGARGGLVAVGHLGKKSTSTNYWWE